MHRKPATSTLITAVTAVIGLLLLMAAPAVAGNHDTRSQGRSENAQNGQNNSESRPAPRQSNKPQPKSTVTEDNDGDGRNNAGQADDGSDNTYPNPSRHPSGKDRYQESGGSGNQGNSQSDPDGDSNGGADKPGGTGGTDIYDQDGNNGCGNDQDFEDDNNGNCGGKGKREKGTDEDETEDAGLVAIKSCPETGSMVPVNEGCSTGTTEPDTTTIELDHNLAVRGPEDTVTKVLGTKIAREAEPAQAAAPEVLGVRLSPALSKSVVVGGAVLPFTGGELLVYVVLALGLIGAGAVMMLRRMES